MVPQEDATAEAGARDAESDAGAGVAPRADKAALRAAARARRRAVAPTERESAAEAVAVSLASLPELADARLVLAYCANAEELNPSRAVEGLRAAGVSVAYPRVTGPDSLALHEVTDAAELSPGSFSLLEPSADAPKVEASQLDAVLVPGVAFDLLGHRIGYGGGYYDRLLASLPDRCIRIGLAFDVQVVETLPAERHDVAVDLLVTESAVRRFGSRS